MIVDCRKVPSLFNEGRRLALTVYNVTIIAFLLIPVSFLFQEYLPSAIIQTIGIALNLLGASRHSESYFTPSFTHFASHISLMICSHCRDSVRQFCLHLFHTRGWSQCSIAQSGGWFWPTCAVSRQQGFIHALRRAFLYKCYHLTG
jgi:hypothetical protein